MDGKNMTIKSSENKRYFWLDYARVIAIISITFNHALSRSFMTHVDTLLEFQQMSLMGSFFKALLYVFSRIGVPLFLMISGSLMLKRDYENKEVVRRFVKRNWWPLLRTTLIWLTIMYIYLSFARSSYLRTEGIISGILHYLSTILFVNHSTIVTMASMWYMPMILCLYLMIPIIGIAVKKIDNKYILGLSGLVVVSSMLVPNINTVLDALGINYIINLELSHTDVFSMYLVFVLAGYWIYNDKLEKISSKAILMLFLLGLLGTTLFQFWIYSTPSDYYVRYADVGILFTSVFLFELIKRTADNIKRGRKIITYIASISFGIYFIHICLMEAMNLFLDRVSGITGFSSFAVLEIGSFVLSVIIITILKRITVFKEYVFLIK